MKFKIVFLLFLTGLTLGCNNELNLKTANKKSLLELEDQNKRSLKGFTADSAYCYFLENQHKSCIKYIELCDKNYNLLKKIREKNILTKTQDSLLSLFYIYYPLHRDNIFDQTSEDCLIAFCGGTCNPIGKLYLVPALPDRHIDSYRYWSAKKNINKLYLIVNKLNNSFLVNDYKYLNIQLKKFSKPISTIEALITLELIQNFYLEKATSKLYK